MLKHQKKLILPLTICLSLFACQHVPKIEDKEQCSPEIVLIVDGDRTYIDKELTVCRCRIYRRTPDYLGPVGKSYHKDIMYCNKMVGERSDDYPAVNTFYNEIRLTYLSQGQDCK
jgi:hypothetical protein